MQINYKHDIESYTRCMILFYLYFWVVILFYPIESDAIMHDILNTIMHDLRKWSYSIQSANSSALGKMSKKQEMQWISSAQ